MQIQDDNLIVIERAKPEDAEAVAEVQRITWQATYPNAEAGITEEDIRLRTEGEHGERIPKNIENWRRHIEASDGSIAVFVARYCGKVVGMTAPGFIEGRRRIGALYVLPDMQGKGIGSGLLKKALEWHGGEEDVWLNAASYNTKAINFYKRFGFEQTDAVVIDNGNVYGDKRIPEIEMVLRARP